MCVRQEFDHAPAGWEPIFCEMRGHVRHDHRFVHVSERSLKGKEWIAQMQEDRSEDTDVELADVVRHFVYGSVRHLGV